MFLGLELIWQKFSCGANLEFCLCILDLDHDVLFNDKDDLGLSDS